MIKRMVTVLLLCFAGCASDPLVGKYEGAHGKLGIERLCLKGDHTLREECGIMIWTGSWTNVGNNVVRSEVWGSLQKQPQHLLYILDTTNRTYRKEPDQERRKADE